ncbi:hypothetical protein [Asticcacaulis sp. W401b]|uniref:hypothetical protein n=1 Tax=Asticcacaulis sp. W401b TaxID=3388666 RepID=UPI003970664E
MPGVNRDYLHTAGNREDLILHIPREDAAYIVERLRETRAAELRRAFIIDLAPLCDVLNEKWDRKQPFVVDLLITTFKKKHPEPNWCLPLSEHLFLCVMPTLGENAGARATADLRQAVVDHFVGSVDEPPRLYWVTVTDTDRLYLHAMTPFGFYDASDSSEASQHGGAQNFTDSTAVRTHKHGALWKVAETPYRILCTLEPLFEMRKLTMIGHRLKVTVLPLDSNSAVDRKQLANLDWSIRERIDIANLQLGISQLRAKAPDQRRMVMVVPAAFSTFSSTRGRARMITEVSRGCKELGIRCIFEVKDIDGVPTGRMSEIVAMLRPFSMTCIGSVKANPKSISGVKDCGLGGVSVCIDAGETDDTELESQLSLLSAAARISAGACMVEGFQSLRQLAVAKVAGISHASLQAEVM